MRFRLPSPYTILITRTGETPVAITLRPLPIFMLGLVLAAFPVIWVVKLVGHNEQLAERNENLTATANEVLVDLETLDSEVKDLRQRAGLAADGTPPSTTEVEPSQGGVSRSVDAEALFSLAF